MLLTIALERYISIVCPLRHHSLMNKKNAVLIIAFCWIYAMIVGALPLLGWNSIDVFHIENAQLTLVENTLSCIHNPENCSQASNVSYKTPAFQCLYQNVISGSYAGFMYPGHFVVMWIVMIILYGHIYLKTRHRTLSGDTTVGVRRLSMSLRRTDSSGKKYCKRIKENWKAIRILAVIVGYFIFSWLGMVIWYGALFKGFTLNRVRQEKPPLPYWFYNVAIILAFGNSVMNPFIYGLGHRKVRLAFLSTLCCDKSKRRHHRQASLSCQKANNHSSSVKDKDFIPMNRYGGQVDDV